MTLASKGKCTKQSNLSSTPFPTIFVFWDSPAFSMLIYQIYGTVWDRKARTWQNVKFIVQYLPPYLLRLLDVELSIFPLPSSDIISKASFFPPVSFFTSSSRFSKFVRSSKKVSWSLWAAVRFAKPSTNWPPKSEVSNYSSHRHPHCCLFSSRCQPCGLWRPLIKQDLYFTNV